MLFPSSQVRKYRIRSMMTTLLARTFQGNKWGWQRQVLQESTSRWLFRWLPYVLALPPLLDVDRGSHFSTVRNPSWGECAVTRQWDGVAFSFIHYDNTWYYQSHCSLAESGVWWSPSQLKFYRWPLEFVKQVSPRT